MRAWAGSSVENHYAPEVLQLPGKALSLAVFGLFFAGVQGGLVRPTIRWLGECTTVIVGIFIDVPETVIEFTGQVVQARRLS